MKTRADDDAHMTLLRTRVDGVEVNAHATLRPDEMAKTRWGTAKATCNDKDWGPEAAFDAGVSDSAESSSSPCSCQAVVLALRAVIVSAAAWFAAVLVVCVAATGDTPLDIPPAMALLLALACLALYIFELRSRHQFWAVARPGGGSDGEAFAARIQMLRDAEPRVDLCYPGAPPVTYRIAEWRDETRPADPDGFLGAPRGLFLVSFPLQVFPGDPSEASALEFAQVQCAASACGAPTPGKLPLDECGPLCEDASKVAVVARLKWLDGSEIAEAAPQVLAEGHEAECLRPFLILSVPLLLGLVADSVLRVMLTPLAWPVRKRIFTIQGSNLGVLRFGFSTRGEVRIEGDEDDLRHANRFWLSEQDWRSLWSTSQEFAARVARFRRARLLACCGAGVAAAMTAVLIILGTWLREPALTSKEAVSGGLVSAAGLFAAAGLAGFMAHSNAQDCARRFESLLRGTAACSANWREGGPDMLVITIEQLATEKSAKASQQPIGSHSAVSKHGREPSGSKREFKSPTKY